MTLQEFADSIADNEGRDHDYQFKERIKAAGKAVLSLLLRRELDQRGYLPDSLVKTVKCVPVVEANNDSCSAPIYCKVRRTKNKIPTPLRTKIASDFIYVGGVTGFTPFNYINPARVPFLRYNPFTKNIPYYTYVNGFIYLINSEAESITIKFIPEDIEKLADIKGEDGKAIFDVEKESYFPMDMIPIIKQMVYEELRISKQPLKEEVKIEDTDEK